MTVNAPAPRRLAGLTDPDVPPLERVAIRLRESGSTLSAWRLSARAREGAGSVVRVETAGGPLFRGEGVFLGWTQDALAGAWAELVPAPSGSDALDGPQLG